RRNKVNWHYVRDDHMFTTIKLVSRHQNTQQFGALLPIELTNEDIKNSNAYKEYYAVATGATPPKPKASVRKTRSSSKTIITPPTAASGPRLTTSEKGKQAAKASKAKSLFVLSEVGMKEAQQMKLATKRSLQLLLVASFICCASFMPTSERADRLLALEALAACLPFSDVLIIERKVTLADDDGKSLKKIDYSDDHDSEDEFAGTMGDTYESGDYNEDPYDDDMYEGKDLPDKIQDICDSLDIRVRGRRKK
nr:hypothetical protein [Tanacetum cinerariifolium]